MKAMIFAAGEGRRMRPLTLDTPKPLLKVKNKPLIIYHIEALKKSGIENIVINVSYLGQKIIDALGDGQAMGVNIEYSIEKTPMETAGGIRKALKLLGDDNFILVNGDVFTEFDFSLLKNVSLASKLAHLIFVENPEHNLTGDFSLSSSGDVLFAESDSNLTFAGISVLNPQLIKSYPKQRETFALREVFDWAVGNNSMSGEVFKGLWQDVGTPERLQSLNTV